MRYSLIKRLMDVFFSVVLIILLLPIFFLIIIMIKFDSKGPVVFSQRRIGKYKIEFKILKFRTMYIDAPKDVPTHLLKDADRSITKVGKFLRKTSLDELPQLFNILFGEMSFIGPRPALYNQEDLIELRDLYGINNFIPGLTGWAQVNGRDELEIPIKVEYDKYYTEKMSFRLDSKIFFMTILGVVSSKGIVEGKKK